jgi:hypothetical protein
MYIKKSDKGYVMSYGGRILNPNEVMNMVNDKTIEGKPLGKYGLNFLKLAYGGDVELPDNQSKDIDNNAMIATNSQGGTNGSHESGQNIPVSKDGQNVAAVEPGEVIADINGKQVALSKRLPNPNHSFADIYMELSKQKKELENQKMKVSEFDKRGTIEREMDKIDTKMSMLPAMQERMKPESNDKQAAEGMLLDNGGDVPTKTYIPNTLGDLQNSYGETQNMYSFDWANNILDKTTDKNNTKSQPTNYSMNDTKIQPTKPAIPSSPSNPNGYTNNTSSNSDNTSSNSDNTWSKLANLTPFIGDIANQGLINQLKGKALPLPNMEQIPTLNKNLDISQSEKNIKDNQTTMNRSIREGTSSGNVASARTRANMLDSDDKLGALYQSQVNFKNEREMAQSQLNTEVNNRNLGKMDTYNMNEDARIRDIISKESQLYNKVGEQASNLVNRQDKINLENKQLNVYKETAYDPERVNMLNLWNNLTNTGTKLDKESFWNEYSKKYPNARRDRFELDWSSGDFK